MNIVVSSIATTSGRRWSVKGGGSISSAPNQETEDVRTSARYFKHLQLSRVFARFFALVQRSQRPACALRSSALRIESSALAPSLNAQILATTCNDGSRKNVSSQFLPVSFSASLKQTTGPRTCKHARSRGHWDTSKVRCCCSHRLDPR